MSSLNHSHIEISSSRLQSLFVSVTLANYSYFPHSLFQAAVRECPSRSLPDRPHTGCQVSLWICPGVMASWLGNRDMYHSTWLSSPPLLILSRDWEACPEQRNRCLSHTLLVLVLGDRKVVSGAVHEAGLGLAGCQAIYGAESQPW